MKMERIPFKALRRIVKKFLKDKSMEEGKRKRGEGIRGTFRMQVHSDRWNRIWRQGL